MHQFVDRTGYVLEDPGKLLFSDLSPKSLSPKTPDTLAFPTDADGTESIQGMAFGILFGALFWLSVAAAYLLLRRFL